MAFSTPSSASRRKDSTARSSVTRSTSGCRRRCRRRSITPATNSKIGPRAGLKVMLFSNPESRGSKERRNFPRSRNGWRTIIPKRIAATKLGCYHCGKRRSTRQAEFRGRSALQRPSFSLSSSSLAPTSVTFFSRVLLLSVAICIGSTMFFALMPAVQASHVDLSGALKSEGAGVVGGSGRSRLRSALVLVQVSLSFVLLAGTGLLLQSLQRMQNTSPGFFTNNVMVAVVDLFSAGYKLDRAKIFHTQLLDRVRALPGVESAALTRVMPFSYNPPSSAPIEIDGYQPAPDEQPNADYVQVSEDYFSTLGIPLVAGREFTRNDDEDSPRVAIINETMAAKYWQGKDPLGQRLKVKDTWMQIVGVAKNVYYETKLEAPRSFFYVPVRQNFFVGNTLLIRTRETPGAITNALSREVHALDPTLAPYAADRLQEQVDQRGYTQRLAVTLLAIFGGMALFLATIGLYAVMSYSVSQRTHELGLRMALGADAGNLLRLVLSHGLRLTTAGILVGAIAALVLTRLMGNLLYKVSPRDPLAFGSALVVITLASLAACFLPAWRATRVDPVQALREQ